MRTSRAPDGHYLPTLDGWRAISITAVVLCHDSAHRLGPLSTQWIYDHGHNGVDVFFAISGLLICSRLMSEEERKGSIQIGEFYIRRAFRILPPAIFYLAMLVVLRIAIALPVGYPEIGSALLFVRNYTVSFQHLQTIYPIYTSHFWSLAPLSYIGRLSYSMYLWQQLFFVSHYGSASAQIAWLQRWPWCLIMTVGMSMFSYYFVERPFLRIGRRVVSRWLAQVAEGQQRPIAI